MYIRKRASRWKLIGVGAVALGLVSCATSFTMEMGRRSAPVTPTVVTANPCPLFQLPERVALPAQPGAEVYDLADDEIALVYAKEYVKMRQFISNERQGLYVAYQEYLQKCVRTSAE